MTSAQTHQQCPEYSEDRYACQKYCIQTWTTAGANKRSGLTLRKMDLSTAPPHFRLAAPPPPPPPPPPRKDHADARVLVNLDETKGKQRNAAKWTKRVILVGAQGL